MYNLLTAVQQVRGIVKNDLHYRPYKMQIVQALQPLHYNSRLHFSQAMLHVIRNGVLTTYGWVLSEEAHFPLSGLINKQNLGANKT